MKIKFQIFLIALLSFLFTQSSFSQSYFLPEKGVFINSKQTYGIAPNQFSLGYRINKNFSLEYSINQYSSSFFSGNSFRNEFRYSSLQASYSKYLDSKESVGINLTLGVHSNAFIGADSFSDAFFIYSINPSVFKRFQINDKIEVFPTLTYRSHFNKQVSSSSLDLSIPVSFKIGNSMRFVFEPSYMIYQPSGVRLITNSQPNSNLGLKFGIHF